MVVKIADIQLCNRVTRVVYGDCGGGILHISVPSKCAACMT
jgi:hypothetical protein